MTLRPDIALTTLDGRSTNLGEFDGQVLLVVNVASKCGLTPQYEALQALHERFADRGFTVLGFPCNQFMGQEPGSNTEIQEFCSTNYGVTFPMFDKVDVNGPDRHPLFNELTQTDDADGEAGDVKWNFEKFLVARDRSVAARWRPMTTPDDPAVVSAVESALADDGDTG
jgi:glutathione peroxidase